MPCSPEDIGPRNPSQECCRGYCQLQFSANCVQKRALFLLGFARKKAFQFCALNSNRSKVQLSSRQELLLLHPAMALGGERGDAPVTLRLSGSPLRRGQARRATSNQYFVRMRFQFWIRGPLPLWYSRLP